jgi:spermidine dehydrogenase
MSNGITRRDYIDGALAGAAALALGPLAPAAAAASPYPPALTGLRGNAPGSFDVAHALALEG